MIETRGRDSNTLGYEGAVKGASPSHPASLTRYGMQDIDVKQAHPEVALSSAMSAVSQIDNSASAMKT